MNDTILSQDESQSTEKPKRKAISDKLRFEVFKRDSFRCQYCGMSAPDVVLNVDHIDPVSNGGTNDILNLITSCRDCNSGKSDRLLSENSMLEKQRKMLADLEERRQQLQMMIDWRNELSGFDDEQVHVLIEVIDEKIAPSHVTNSGYVTVLGWLKKYSFAELLAAIDATRIVRNSDGGVDGADYFSRVERTAAVNRKPESERELLYIRGILRNRLSFLDERKVIMWLKQAYAAGHSIEELKELAITVKNWTQFRNVITGMIENG